MKKLNNDRIILCKDFALINNMSVNELEMTIILGSWVSFCMFILLRLFVDDWKGDCDKKVVNQ